MGRLCFLLYCDKYISLCFELEAELKKYREKPTA